MCAKTPGILKGQNPFNDLTMIWMNISGWGFQDEDWHIAGPSCCRSRNLYYFLRSCGVPGEERRSWTSGSWQSSSGLRSRSSCKTGWRRAGKLFHVCLPSLAAISAPAHRLCNHYGSDCALDYPKFTLCRRSHNAARHAATSWQCGRGCVMRTIVINTPKFRTLSRFWRRLFGPGCLHFGGELRNFSDKCLDDIGLGGFEGRRN
jgi:hypothetical protein